MRSVVSVVATLAVAVTGCSVRADAREAGDTPAAATGGMAPDDWAPKDARSPVPRPARRGGTDIGEGLDLIAVGESLRERLAQAEAAGILVFADSLGGGAIVGTPADPWPGDSAIAAQAPSEPSSLPSPMAGFSDYHSTIDLSAPSTVAAGVRRLDAKGHLPALRTAADDPPQPPAIKPPECLPEEAFGLPDIVPGAAALARISALQAEVVGEFDRASRAVALDLARHLAALGLMAETRQVLREFVSPGPDREAVELLATLLGPRRAATSIAFENMACGRRHDLLRSYQKALIGNIEAGDLRDEALRRELHAMPIWPRTRMATAFALAAIRAGEREAASWFQTMAGRGADLPGQSGDGLDFIDALVDFTDGEIERGARVLAKLALGGGSYAADAAIDLARLGVREPRSAPYLDDALLAALATHARMARERGGSRPFLEAEAKVTAALAGQGAAIAVLSRGLQLGMLDTTGYAEALSVLGEYEPAPVAGRPLALIFDEAPQHFENALRQSEFRKALALSRAEVGAPALARRILQPSDLQDQAFLKLLQRRIERFSSGFPAVARSDSRTERADAADIVASDDGGGVASDGAVSEAADVSSADAEGAVPSVVETLNRARRTLADTDADIVAIRRMLSDG